MQKAVSVFLQAAIHQEVRQMLAHLLCNGSFMIRDVCISRYFRLDKNISLIQRKIFRSDKEKYSLTNTGEICIIY